MRYQVGDVLAKRFSASWLSLRRRIVGARPTGYSWSYTFAPMFVFRSEGTPDPFFVYWELVERASPMGRRVPHSA